MSIWVNVYCRKPIKEVDTTIMVAEIRERAIDFSEFFAREDPEQSLLSIRVDKCDTKDSPPLLHLHYLEDGPPVVVSCVSDSRQVEGEVQEYFNEFFSDHVGEQATLVRKHLEGTVEIVHFCLKQLHADGMGTPLVYAASAWLADIGDGLVRADNQGWMKLMNWGGFTIIEPE